MFELVLTCPEAQVETVTEALEALDALSVSIEDNDADTPHEQALFGEPGMPPPKEAWLHSRLTALFPNQEQAQAALDLLQAQPFFADSALVALREVANEDWVRLTQSQFSPVPVTSDFWIVPTWHEPPEQARHIIRLDPGLAFGTGTHPTTRMCLRWIAQHGVQDQRVLDYGCGSGILAIGAAKYGATQIDAVDIDDAAVTSTELNAQANKQGDVPIHEFKRDLLAVSENAPLSRVLDIFLEQHQHIAMVINEYGEAKGLISLEDLVETLLGEEIVDEGDKVADMRELARIRWQRRAKRMGIEVDSAQ